MDCNKHTVNESVESSSPQEATTPSPDLETETGKKLESKNYDELFPALPGAMPSASRDSPPLSNWSTNSDMRIASSDITQVFRIPRDERARYEGSNQFGESGSSKMCADILAKTGATIEISVARDESLTFVITGKPDEVVKAKRLALERFQTPARQVITIPKDHHRFILGKQYKRLKDLEASTGTKIQVPAANSDSEEIIVIGPRENTEKALHEIQMTSDERTRQTLERMDIPKIYHPFISANDEITEIVAQGTMRLHMPPASVESSEISMVGEKPVVVAAKELITNLVEDLEKNCQTIQVEVPRAQHRFISGSRGAGVLEILKATGVSVEIPPAESNTDTICLRGPTDKLGGALTEVYTKASSVKRETVTAPPFTHKFIIGKKGSNIKQFTTEYPKVHIEFTDNNGIIQLEGPPADVEAACVSLRKIIEDFTNRLTQATIDVNPQYYKFIIGKGGSNINRLRQETGINISISESADKNVINLEGEKEGVAKVTLEINEMVKKMENEKEKSVVIDQKLHRNLIGTKGETIREIRDKFNQVQISFPDSGVNSDVVRVKGDIKDVEACAKYLSMTASKLKEENYEMRVTILRPHHKFIIGKSGATINKLREETNTRIEMPGENDKSEEIVITGRKKDCENAKDKILKIKNELASAVEVDIIIPSKFHNSIIGAGGKQIQSISEECGGVSIKFPSPDSKSDKVTIRGQKEEVHKAKQLLVDLSNEKEISGFTAEVKAKPQIHRFLIGRNGVNIRKIRDKTGARIFIPSEKDKENDTITIMGTKESVKQAKQELEAVIKNLDNVVDTVTSVDQKHHRYFVSRRGEILRQISDQFGGVTISFPRQGVESSEVIVKGAKECVEGAINKIQEIVKDLEEMVTIEVEIPQRHHRTLMGARGSKVQALSTEFDVQIKFPDKDMVVDPSAEVNGHPKPQDIVIVQGKQEKCLKAKEALLDAIQVTEEVIVPYQHHRYLIGVKGETVKQLITTYDVQIKVPPVQEKCDTVTIIGPRSKVDAAKNAILLKVDEFKAEEEDRIARSNQLKMTVPMEYMPKIIGRKGAVISKIRDDHNVIIQFPKRGTEEEDTITIMGYEKDCEEARLAILAITDDLERMIKEVIHIDPRIHSRLIGTKGKALRKVMDDYKVDIKFPRPDSDDVPDEVVITGLEENVDECREHLLQLTEEFMDDIVEQEDLNRYIAPTNGNHEEGSKSKGKDGRRQKGFVVTGAPWTQSAPQLDSSEDFPSMGGSSSPSMTPSWGPKRS